MGSLLQVPEGLAGVFAAECGYGRDRLQAEFHEAVESRKHPTSR